MRQLPTLLLLALFIPTLQGCVPIVAGGIGAGVAMANDRRTSGIYIEDQSIEIKAQSRISEKFKDQVHINTTSYNLSVLITGEAPNDAVRAEVENSVKGIPNVRQVFNEVAIAPISSFSNRSNDSYLTTKVKARMVDTNKFNVIQVKVVSEASVVYLLGLVTHKEAEDATEIARTTSGVQKVVRLFEYLD
jgi:osmotically-inducible protein OsmY